MKYFHRLLSALYQFSKAVRVSVLTSQFGYVSQCTHSPTCGEYTVEAIKKNGFSGLIDGLGRLSRCMIIPSRKKIA